MKIITWNMDYWKKSPEQRDLGWNYLHETLKPDIAILQEVVPPESLNNDYNILFHEIGGRRKWGNAIITKHKIIKEIYRQNLYEGSTGLMVVEIQTSDNLIITVINIYGLIDSDGYVTTTMHHILSDLTPILVNKKLNIVLAGDFNTSLQFDEQYRNRFPAHKLVFDHWQNYMRSKQKG